MVCSYGSGDELSNLHPINSQAINKLQSQVYIWNSNPGLRTSSLMYQLSISRYRKNPEIPDIAMWYFREKTVGNKMMKFMRKYDNPTEDVLVSLKEALSTLVILYTARISSFDLLTVVTVKSWFRVRCGYLSSMKKKHMITIASSVDAARECSLFTWRTDIAAIGYSSKYFHGHFKAVEPYGLP